jgi:hypothetical protein
MMHHCLATDLDTADVTIAEPAESQQWAGAGACTTVDSLLADALQERVMIPQPQTLQYLLAALAAVVMSSFPEAMFSKSRRKLP